jgi:uncharacterized membrane protein YhaH (DUF805 family)
VAGRNRSRAAALGVLRTYLSPAGTLTRQAFAVAMARLVAASVLAGVPLYAGYTAARDSGHSAWMLVCGLSLMMVLFGSAWSSLVLQIQRLHDQGRRGHSAVAMTILGLVCAPLLALAGIDEATGGRTATVLTLGYLAWLLIHKGRRSDMASLTRPAADPPLPPASPVMEARPHPACESVPASEEHARL